MLFSDESKYDIYGNDDIQYVHWPQGKRLDPKYVVPTVKHGGGNIMVWGCFSYYGMGPIHKISGTMDRFKYLDILKNVMMPYAEWEMPLKFIFQHDNDPKHTANVVKDWIAKEKIRVMKWPAQSPDLNLIENLWEITNRQIRKVTIRNKDQLFEEVQKGLECS